MTFNRIQVEPLSRAIGAEIKGIDLASPITDQAFAEMRRAFGEYGVIFFRDQRLTPDQHVGLPSDLAQLTSIASSLLCPTIQ